MILIVDDDPVTTDHFARMLRLEGYDVDVAYDGRAGLARALLIEPTVVILDLNMPLLDGVSLLETLRTQPRLRTVPAVVITGKSDLGQPLLNRLDALGATVHYKPVWCDDLVDIVRERAFQYELSHADDDAGYEEAPESSIWLGLA